MNWRAINYYAGYAYLVFAGMSIVMAFGDSFPTGFMLAQAVILLALGAARIARGRS